MAFQVARRFWPSEGAQGPSPGSGDGCSGGRLTVPQSTVLLLEGPSEGEAAVRVQVKKGQAVLAGQRLAEPAGPDAAALHSPVSGKVLEVRSEGEGGRAGFVRIVLESDGEGREAADELPRPLASDGDLSGVSPEQIAEAAAQAGLAGMGGGDEGIALGRLFGGRIGQFDTLLVVGCPQDVGGLPERFVMEQHPAEVATGILATAKALGVRRLVIAIDKGWTAARKQMESALFAALTRNGLAGPAGSRPHGAAPNGAGPNGTRSNAAGTRLNEATRTGASPDGTAAAKRGPVRFESIRWLAVDGYPQGIGALLIRRVSGRPAALGVVTLAALGSVIRTGRPVTHRPVGVSGGCVGGGCRVVEAPLGLPLVELLRVCGAQGVQPGEILRGGLMRGHAVTDPEAAVSLLTERVTGLLPEQVERPFEPSPCIRCGRCVDACPAGLLPTELVRHAERSRWEEAAAAGLDACVECGCCSFVCPSHRPLSPWIRVAKAHLAAKRREQAALDHGAAAATRELEGVAS